ncbi:hypothetical protein [Streptomyces sp. NPDC085937]|uniref:hypothetical protein n=1 Tax=Streptomyces sp. NPDC085937 TaxID=3365742 RepID=UPI0037D50A75
MTHQTQPMFGVDGCTCIPFTQQTNPPRHLKPTDTIDMISGWERGQDCPHHAPAAVSAAVAPPTNRAALRDRIAAAIYECNNPGYQWADAHPDDRLAYGFDADAVLAVLPTTDRTAVLREADWIVEHCPDHGCVEPATEVCHCEIADRLRRMADETATEPPQPSLRERHRAAWHALTPDQQAARLAELDTPDEPAAETQQDETATETPNVYLTTPCDACNHTLNWHSSGETGCTVPRCACARYYHAAGARQDGAET